MLESGPIQRRQKEVWDGGKTTRGLGMGVPQRGPEVEPRYEIVPEAEEFLK